MQLERRLRIDQVQQPCPRLSGAVFTPTGQLAIWFSADPQPYTINAAKHRVEHRVLEGGGHDQWRARLPNAGGARPWRLPAMPSSYDHLRMELERAARARVATDPHSLVTSEAVLATLQGRRAHAQPGAGLHTPGSLPPAPPALTLQLSSSTSMPCLRARRKHAMCEGMLLTHMSASAGLDASIVAAAHAPAGTALPEARQRHAVIDLYSRWLSQATDALEAGSAAVSLPFPRADRAAVLVESGSSAASENGDGGEASGSDSDLTAGMRMSTSDRSSSDSDDSESDRSSFSDMSEHSVDDRNMRVVYMLRGVVSLWNTYGLLQHGSGTLCAAGQARPAAHPAATTAAHSAALDLARAALQRRAGQAAFSLVPAHFWQRLASRTAASAGNTQYRHAIVLAARALMPRALLALASHPEMMWPARPRAKAGHIATAESSGFFSSRRASVAPDHLASLHSAEAGSGALADAPGAADAAPGPAGLHWASTGLDPLQRPARAMPLHDSAWFSVAATFALVAMAACLTSPASQADTALAVGKGQVPAAPQRGTAALAAAWTRMLLPASQDGTDDGKGRELLAWMLQSDSWTSQAPSGSALHATVRRLMGGYQHSTSLAPAVSPANLWQGHPAGLGILAALQQCVPHAPPNVGVPTAASIQAVCTLLRYHDDVMGAVVDGAMTIPGAGQRGTSGPKPGRLPEQQQQQQQPPYELLGVAWSVFSQGPAQQPVPASQLTGTARATRTLAKLHGHSCGALIVDVHGGSTTVWRAAPAGTLQKPACVSGSPPMTPALGPVLPPLEGGGSTSLGRALEPPLGWSIMASAGGRGTCESPRSAFTDNEIDSVAGTTPARGSSAPQHSPAGTAARASQLRHTGPQAADGVAGEQAAMEQAASLRQNFVPLLPLQAALQEGMQELLRASAMAYQQADILADW